MSLIHINRHLVKKIESIAIHQFPEECCGFIWGHENEVVFAKEVRNASFKDKNESFEISHTDYLFAEEFAVKNRLSLLGVFHSHPNEPAEPSAEDLKFAMPNFINIIVSVSRQKLTEMRAWQRIEYNEELKELNLIIK